MRSTIINKSSPMAVVATCRCRCLPEQQCLSSSQRTVENRYYTRSMRSVTVQLLLLLHT